jgi:hypothetical protein
MKMTKTGMVPDGFARGPFQGNNIIGETTEALHRFLLDGWNIDRPAPRIEEDLSFVPKDREEVLYVYMYRTERNSALLNSKAWRPAKIVPDEGSSADVYYERAPIYLNLHYLVAVHSKFRSDAERLLGWVFLRLNEATHLVYRPRKYILPNGSQVDSTGSAWDPENIGDETIMEKVALALVDDLTVGDAINFYTIHEAPYRPFVTYRAQCAMEGSLVAGPSTTVRAPDYADRMGSPKSGSERSNGRMVRSPERAARRAPIGPQGHDFQRATDNNSSEDK